MTTQLDKILDILNRKGPLDNRKISELGKVPYGTVRSYTSLLYRGGHIERFKGMRGIFELTDSGKELLRKREGEQEK